ncbi:MAG: hypothetical protein LBU85_00670 [Treponema sp.]|nr:hypothetical protein [Treponema sp.]
MPGIEGFEPERSRDKYQGASLAGANAAHGCAGSAKAGVEGADRKSATGTPNPSLSGFFMAIHLER